MSKTVEILGLGDLKMVYPGFTVQYDVEPLDIRITQRIAGICNQSDPLTCLIATAAGFSLADGEELLTFPTVSYVVAHNAKEIRCYRNSASTTRLIRHYDDTGEVLPGVYQLLQVPQSQRGRRTGKVTPGTGTTNRKRQPARQLHSRRVARIEVGA